LIVTAQTWATNRKPKSLEQFKRKQEQFDAEAASANNLLNVALHTYEHLQDMAFQALDLARNAAQAYRAAEPLYRRVMNQAIFTKILITEDGLQGSILAPPF
jgi:hypothetical protein